MAPKEDVNRLKTTRSSFRAVADQLTKKILDLMEADTNISVKKRAIEVYNTISFLKKRLQHIVELDQKRPEGPKCNALDLSINY